MLQVIYKFALLSFYLVLTGCAITSPQQQINALGEIPSGHVLVVGKITLDPPLNQAEREVTVPNDLFGFGEMISNRAILGFSDQSSTTLESSGFFINPELGKTFFYAIPRNRTNMVEGYITVSYSISALGTHGGKVNHGKVLVPRFRLDLKEGDEIVYIGTLHLERGAFNDVEKARLKDEYKSALSELSQRFGMRKSMRKAFITK